MADNSTGSGNEPLLVCIQQLEQERDELRKDIEQLCMQQAGPGYLVVATKMHFQRTAALEQEIENLKKKLASCTRDNVNLQEELSEAYRIKSQLADLHNAEVTKNLEAEKQLKFFQGCVATAFAERDHSIMEAEKAKEKEEIMHQKLSDVQKRMEKLYSDCLEKEKLIDKLQADLVKQEEDNEAFKKVIDMFYEIRQQSFEGCDNRSWDQKSTCLLSDPPETWSYNDLSTSNYISALEEELQSVRNSVDDLQNKLRVGLEIENHLKKKVRELEKKKLASDKMMRSSLAGLRHHHSIHRLQIMNVLEDEKSYIKSVVSMMNNKIRQVTETGEMNVECPFSTMGLHKNGSSDQNLNIDAGLDLISYTGMKQVDRAAMGDATEAFAQALQEKVSALLLLSQQEERHLLDRNVNAALQKKIEELQRNLLQVTNEKVKALMELAKLREDYQLLQEKTGPGMKGKDFAAREENRLVMQEQDGKLRNLLKKTYLNRLIGSTMEFARKVGEVQVNYEGNVSSRKSNNSIEFARMKIENATLKESLESVDHLTSSIHRLRVSLSQAKESAAGGTVVGVSEALEEIISEALLIKTALSSCLPVSWSAGEDTEPSLSATVEYASADSHGDSSSEKVDSVSAAGFEMVEVLVLAAQTVKEYMNRRMAS